MKVSYYNFVTIKKNTLAELVESFDFAHIKLGATIKCEFVTRNNLVIKDVELYISEDWVNAQLTGESYYTGSEYPLSSLTRLPKYYKRENFHKKGFNTIKVLTDIIERGFKDYEDFKDQIDSVDVRVAEDSDTVYHLYKVCLDRGLVKNQTRSLKEEKEENE